MCFTVNGSAWHRSSIVFAADDVGKWSHIAFVYDSVAKQVAFYIDGRLDRHSRPCRFSRPGPVRGLKIGGGLAAEVDDFRLYAKALTTAEIAELAKSVRFTNISDAKKLTDVRWSR